ncbi:hypothetical protein PR048_014266 [Dryococelus australis]|uniref:DDE-1 domain-containing protein n=1 Tax=Dryococelus australis TaxID=614101 RepID=A0ABQ9HEH6_9NEOP|nr:hypothetical protein PR048_014266 [Dryococelus australis]
MLKEKISSDLAAGSDFQEKYIKEALEKGYSRGDVYNADETGINWQALPRKSLASRCKKSAPGFKVSKERITDVECANASGELKVKLLVIGKSKRQHCFKNVETLLSCFVHKSAWMTSAIFIDWFKNVFIPSVTKFHVEKKKSGKVLLIIDNTPTHPALKVLNKIDQNFEVQFLPPNVTATLQPMDQGVIDKMKRIYRKQLRIYKKVEHEDSIYMLADAWETLPKRNLQRAWRKLWPDEENRINENEDCVVNEICSTISGFEQCGKNYASEWFVVEDNDPGYQALSNQKIAVIVSEGDAETVESDGDKNKNDIEEAEPTHSEAFIAAETLMSWLA